MIRKIASLAGVSLLAMLAMSSEAQAWGVYHAGYTHYGPVTGLHHYGYTTAYRGGGYPRYGGYHYGAYHYGGYHYGAYRYGGYRGGYYRRW